MGIRSFKTLSTDSYFVDRVQDNIKQALSNSASNPMNTPILITGLRAAAAGNVSINHTLGKTPKWWFVMPKASVTFYEVSRNTRNLVLNFSGAASFDVMVG